MPVRALRAPCWSPDSRAWERRGLIADAAEHAHDDGAIVLAGICDSELVVPYQPFALALNEPLLTDEQLATAISTRAGPLGPLFPGSRVTRPDDQGPAARFELFEAVAALFQRLSNLQPIVLVLEDLQWATPPTLLLLRHLVQHLDEARLLILGTYRDEEAATNPHLRDLLAEIHGSGSASKIELQALSEHDVTEMIATLVPTAPADNVGTFARRVRDEVPATCSSSVSCWITWPPPGSSNASSPWAVATGYRSPILSVMWSANDWGASPTMPRSSCPLLRWSAWRSTSIW